MGLLNMSNQPKKWDIRNATRIGVRLAGIPLPIQDLLRRKVSGLNPGDLKTNSFRTPLVSIQQAAIETLQLLTTYKVEIDRDFRVVQELLQLNPYFSGFDWVRDAAEKLDECQQAKRKRGRPKWRYTINPEVIIGLVWVLRESGEARSNRDAADWLEISGIMSSTRVLRLLKQAKKDARLKPMVSPPPNSWPDYTEEELIRMFETAITPEEGQTLIFELQGDHFQHVRTLDAADPPSAGENNS